MSAKVVDKFVEALLVLTGVFLGKLVDGVLEFWVEAGLIGNPVAVHGKRGSFHQVKNQIQLIVILFNKLWYSVFTHFQPQRHC